MRELARFPETQSAARLADVLLAEGIETTVNTARDGQLVVWVHDELKLPQARTLAEELARNPDDPRFGIAARIAKERRSEMRRHDASRPPLIRAREHFATAGQLSYSLAPLSAVLIAISVIVAALTQLGERQEVVQLLTYAGYHSEGAYIIHNGLSDISKGQIYRLITPMFIHFGAAHLIFNMWWIKDLGSMIERRQSALVLAILVLVLSAVSNTAQFLAGGPSFGGMSGVVYGLFGYIWMRGRFDPASRYGLSQRDIVWMMLWLVACYTGFIGPVANTAHTVGLGVGALWGFFSSGYLQRRLRRP